MLIMFLLVTAIMLLSAFMCCVYSRRRKGNDADSPKMVKAGDDEFEGAED